MPFPPVLLVTRDDRLLEDLLRLCAAAGVAPDVAHDAPSALRGWSAAAVVLLGADLAAQVAAQRPPRRDRVHVVGHGPLRDDLFRSALAAGAVDISELPAAEGWLVEVLSDAVDAGEGGHGGRARTIGVVAGSGGAGATTLACALALVAAGSGTALLLDLDPWGPGLDSVVGLDPGGGARWDALVSSRGRLGSRSLRAALPERSGCSVLTWGTGPAVELDAGSVREVLSAAQRGNDTVVVDLPRALDEVTSEVVTRCDVVLLVAEPTLVGVSAAGRLISALRPLNDHLGLAVRSGRGAIPSAQVAGALGLPVVLEVPHQRRLAEQVELGLGPVPSRRSPLARAARSALTEADLFRADA